MTKKTNDIDGALSDVPNDRYKKFFAKFKDIDTLPVSDWRPPQLIGYFARLYKQTYGTDYTWKFNNPAPSKCFETWQMGVLSSKLSSDPQILRDYIDWAFQNIVPKAKRKLTSISFLTREEVLTDYKMNVLLANQTTRKIDRSTSLPTGYKTILDDCVPHLNIVSYGDLAFACMAEPLRGRLPEALCRMGDIGFDRHILSRIV